MQWQRRPPNHSKISRWDADASKAFSFPRLLRVFYDGRLSRNFRRETSRSLSDPAVVWTLLKRPLTPFLLQSPLRRKFLCRKPSPKTGCTRRTTLSRSAPLWRIGLGQLTSILLGGSRTDVTAYLAPPDDAVRCIIHMAYNDETHREILEELVPYNTDLPIIDARPFGKKRFLLITLATGPLPKAIRFWAGIHTCFPHRPKVEACNNCRRIGHRQDVCPAPPSRSCHNCGDHHVPTEPPTCSPKCIVCGDGHHTGNVECKYRYARRPPRTTQLAAGHQSRSQEKEQPGSRQPSRSALRSASRDRSHKPRQDLTWADRARKSPQAPAQQTANHNNDGELRALREEVSRLTALTQRSLAPPTPSLLPSPPTAQTHANTTPPSSTLQKTTHGSPHPPTSGSIDINAKLKNLSDQFDKKLQEQEGRIETKFNALITDVTTKLEARIEQCMETILQRMVGPLETRLTQLPPLAAPLSPHSTTCRYGFPHLQ
ncbi:hypothetical protein MTO96_021943 [Rhipicephalus appendiculatus]